MSTHEHVGIGTVGFGDTKNVHLGMGLSATHVRTRPAATVSSSSQPSRHAGHAAQGAGERCGLDRTLKSNTSAKRQLSLYNQGLHWYMAIPRMRVERLRLLIDAYGEVLKEHQLTRDLLGVI